MDTQTISPRVARLVDTRKTYHDRTQIPHRDTVYRQVFSQFPDDIAAMRFARAFSQFLDEKKILVTEDDILAGFAFRYTYNTTIAIEMPMDYDPHYRPTVYVASQREADESKAVHGAENESPLADTLDFFAKGVKNWLFKHWESGHILPGYEKVLLNGFDGLIQEGETAFPTVDDTGKLFVEAMLICCRAARRYILRYETMAGELAKKCTDPEKKIQLQKIQDSCKRISGGKAQTFFDAVQLLWLTHEMIYVETKPSSVSLGRLDKILNPFYQKDLKDHAIDPVEASEILDALWIKFGATLHAYQNITIGGIDEKGNSVVNDMTYMMLASTKKFRFDQPLISLRCDENMPEKLWDKSFDLLKTGIGFPAFFNDDMCIKAKQEMDIPLADARDYALIGCVEMGTPGKEYAKTEVLRVNWAMILEMLFTGGKTLSGDWFNLKTPRNLSDITSFDQFYNWYKEELLYLSKRAMESINILDESLMWIYPTPFLSATMAECFPKGRDLTGGGTTYNNTGINACGMANAVDSLMAVKKLVFEDRDVTLEKMAEILACNWEGYEELHHKASRKVPKYGNEVNECDGLMADLVACYADLVAGMDNPRGGKFQLGLYSVEDHSNMGRRTGALPDGRKAETSLANAISPVQGKDINGPTAVINSLLKTDLSAAKNGMVLDLKFSPQFMENPRHLDALKALIFSYFKQGGMEVQFNVVDRQTLIDAQKHPENHKDLVVRVSGFSAYFTTLVKTTQDEIIARTQYDDM